MSNQNNPFSPCYRDTSLTPIAQSVRDIQHIEIAPKTINQFGQPKSLAQNGLRCLEVANKSDGLKGASAGATAGVLLAGAAVTVISAPITLPVLAGAALLGALWGWVKK